MTYQVLARKWRPQDFRALIGQEPVVTALRNALRDDRIAQAYLFSGIRGVGKTTAARVLAKALNCERGPAQDPCNECDTCRQITAGGDLDVLEIDAATYSKVEQVRELTESLKYGPANDRYKVVVLDEIHRLSRQAFDALLKIVEEPPSHLVFIFATTEIEAVPATILSRCQEFHFQRVPSELLAAHLRTLSEAEEIEVSETALRLIARAGEGSVRDSVALLDQLATYGGGTIADEDAVRLLGGLDTALFAEALDAIVAGDGAALSSLVRRVEDQGWDPRNVFAQFLAYLRDGLHLALSPDDARVDLPGDERRRLAEVAAEVGSQNLLRLLSLLVAAEPLVRRTEASALALELAWLRAAELPHLLAVEDLLAGGSPPAGGERTSPSRSRPGPAAPAAKATGPPRGRTPQAREAEPRPPGDGAASHLSPDALLQRIADDQPALRAMLASTRLDVGEGRLRIEAAAGSLLRTTLERNRSALEIAARETLGADFRLEIVETAAATKVAEPATRGRTSSPTVEDEPEHREEAPAHPTDRSPARRPAAPRDDREARARREAAQHPTVQAVLDMFPGEITAVELLGPTPEEASAEEPG